MRYEGYDEDTRAHYMTVRTFGIAVYINDHDPSGEWQIDFHGLNPSAQELDEIKRVCTYYAKKYF